MWKERLMGTENNVKPVLRVVANFLRAADSLLETRRKKFPLLQIYIVVLQVERVFICILIVITNRSLTKGKIFRSSTRHRHRHHHLCRRSCWNRFLASSEFAGRYLDRERSYARIEKWFWCRRECIAIAFPFDPPIRSEICRILR